jgi:hypothetical protein
MPSDFPFLGCYYMKRRQQLPTPKSGSRSLPGIPQISSVHMTYCASIPHFKDNMIFLTTKKLPNSF